MRKNSEIEEVLDSRPRMICGRKGKKSRKAMDYFVKWKGWMRGAQLLGPRRRDGQCPGSHRRVRRKDKQRQKTLTLPKIVTRTHQNATMILDHELPEWQGPLVTSLNGMTVLNDGSRILAHIAFEWTQLLKQYWEKSTRKRRRPPWLGMTQTRIRSMAHSCLYHSYDHRCEMPLYPFDLFRIEDKEDRALPA